MKVHLIQLAYTHDESLAERTSRVAGLVRAQRGADLVALPKPWPQGGFSYERWEAEAQPLGGSVVEALREAARDIGATVHMGSFVERDEAGQLFNTAVLLGPDGGILTTYRKVHLFGFGDGEPKHLTAVMLRCARQPRPGDLLRPALPRAVPAAARPGGRRSSCWSRRGQPSASRTGGCWRRRARWRTSRTSSPATPAGTHAGVPMGAQSMVVDPWGVVVAEAGDGEQVLFGRPRPGPRRRHAATASRPR